MSLVQRMPLAVNSSPYKTSNTPHPTDRYHNVPPNPRTPTSRYSDLSSTASMGRQTISSVRSGPKALSNASAVVVRPGPRSAGISPPSRYGDVSTPSRQSGVGSDRPEVPRGVRTSRNTSQAVVDDDDDHQKISPMMAESDFSNDGPYPPPDQITHSSSNATSTASALQGQSIWQRVAVAVGTLSVNVGLSLNADLVAGDGEQTPIGAESRITAALKKYYLASAQSGADLPDWLFSAEERRAAGGTSDNVTGDRDLQSKSHHKSRSAPSSYSQPTAPDHRGVTREGQPPIGELTPRASRMGIASGEFQPRSAVSSRLKQRRDASRGDKNSFYSKIPASFDT